jgi:hypothetical protein
MVAAGQGRQRQLAANLQEMRRAVGAQGGEAAGLSTQQEQGQGSIDGMDW